MGRAATAILALVACSSHSPGAGVDACDDNASCYYAPPQALITEPADGTTFDLGDAVMARGVVADDDDETGDLLVAWWLDGVEVGTSEPDPDGRVDFTLASGGGGPHVLDLQVVDPDGAEGHDTATFDVESE